MRKVLSFVLVLSLVLGSFGSVFAATTTTSTTYPDIVGTEYEDAVNVLSDLGVVSGNPDGTYKPADTVNRAEMASMIVRAMGMESSVAGQTSSFTDMSGYGWAEGYVYYAQSMNVIAGYGDGTFKPGNPVSYDEAATMLVAALGYTPASLTGSWPASHVSKALALKIMENVTAGPGGASRGDIAIMIYQTLNVPIGTVDGDGVWHATNYKSTSSDDDKFDTMLSRLGATEYNDGKAFVVTDTIAKNDSVINMYPYLGAYLTAYMNSDDEIIAVKEVKSDYLTGTVTSDGKFKSGGVEYTISGADYTHTSSTTGGAYYFYNGEVNDFGKETITEEGKDKEVAIIYLTKRDQLKELTDRENAYVTIAGNISGKTVKAVYSAMEWNMEKGEADFYDAEVASEIEKDQTIFGIDFPEDNNRDIDYNAFAVMGVESLKDIEKDNVVYVYYNSSDEVARIEVGTEVVTGKVSRVTGDSSTEESTYTIGGTKYEFASTYDTETEFPKAGDEVKLYLTYNGDIYKAEKSSGAADNFAVVLFAEEADDDNPLDDPRVKLVLADGTSQTFNVDKGEYKAYDKKDLPKGTIIKYSVDKKGNIDDIVIFKDSESGYSPKANFTKNGYYDGYSVNTNAVIFTFDAGNNANMAGSLTDDADDYGVTTRAKLVDTKDVEAYYVVESNKITAMLVNSDVNNDDDVYGVATSSAKNDSDAGYEITFIIDGRDVTYNARSNAYNTVRDAEEGGYDALYKIYFNGDGDVNKVEVQDAAIEFAAGDKGDRFTVSGSTLTVVDAKEITSSSEAFDDLEDGDKVTLYSNVRYLVWNNDDKEYKTGNRTDLNNSTGIVKLYTADQGDKVVDYVLINNYSK